MINLKNNIAYIDGANLHKGVSALGWKLDYHRFRVWLKEKYGVQTAYLFIGLIPKYKDLYTFLQKSGFTLIFKEVVFDGSGQAKGNCDADLVVHVMQDTYTTAFDQVVLVTSDGDYSPLVKFLMESKKIHAVLSPSTSAKCSVLLKRTGVKIAYLHDQRQQLTDNQDPKK